MIMADSASESDTDGAGSSSATPQCSTSSSSSKQQGFVISPFRLEELTNRLASLQQENKVLKIELETFKLKCKALQEENRDLRKASVTIVSAAEGTDHWSVHDVLTDHRWFHLRLLSCLVLGVSSRNAVWLTILFC